MIGAGIPGALALSLLLVLISSVIPASALARDPDTTGDFWYRRTREIAREYDLGSTFVLQIRQESRFRPSIIYGRQVSSAGAEGIAQIIRPLHPGVDPLNPEASLHYAARWMKQLIERYDGSRAKALAAYNAGPGTVDRLVTLGGEMWFEYLPQETKLYLQRTGFPGGAE